MSSITELNERFQQISLLEHLADSFEGITSLRIKEIRNGVLSSKQFFTELWTLYLQLRLDKGSDTLLFQHHYSSNKIVFVVVTSSASLSGTSIGNFYYI